MPAIAAWIDALREAFGTEEVNAAIRRGLRGEALFYAKEGEHEIGFGGGGPKGVPVSAIAVPLPGEVAQGLTQKEEQRRAGRRHRA